MTSDIEISASTNRLIESSVEEELEAQQLSRAKPLNRPVSPEAPVKSPPKFLVLIKSAFTRAWLDISSSDRWKSSQLRRVGCQLLIIIWISGLLCLLIYLPFGALVPLVTPCQSDEDFNFDTIQDTDTWFGDEFPHMISISQSSRFVNHVNRWAFQNFFEVNLSWGAYDFTSAKLIDVTWDLVIGRGGQAIMSLVIWYVFTEYLEVAVASKPVTFTTLWLLRSHQDTSILSTIRLFFQFYRRGLASKFAMFVMIAVLSFTLAFSTIAGSMTGYAASNLPLIEVEDGAMVPFEDVRPKAYVIHDGERMNGYSHNYPVPWKSNMDSSMFSFCGDGMSADSESDCGLQREISRYIKSYGLNAGSQGGEDHDKTTELDGQKIDWPPLNISAYFLPSAFYWDSTIKESSMSRSYSPKSDMMFIVGSQLYNMSELKQHGVCQPILKVKFQRYRWGFSFLQLSLVTVFLFLWSLALMGLWKQAHDTLKLNHRETSSKHWKGLLDFANTIKVQLEQANIEIDNLSDKQLEDEIQKILRGGSMSSQPLSEGSSSIWCWLRRKKWWIGSYICIMTQIVLNLVMAPWYALPPPLFATFLFLAFAIGSTFIEIGLLFVLGGLLCWPMIIPGISIMLLPGVLLGIFLAFAVGSTKGSRLVLFLFPFLCNYIPILAWVFLPAY